MNKFFLLLFLTFLIIFTGCSKDNNPVEPEVTKGAGIYVLAEGTFASNNSSLTYYNVIEDKLIQNAYFNSNNTNLGETANDMQIIDSTAYIVLAGSRKIEILRTTTFNSLGSINVGDNARELLILNKDIAYLTSYENGGEVKKIDLKTKNVIKSIKVGANPEAIALVKGKLFVANSGWGSARTVSVIDISNDTEIKKINVGYNPQSIAVDELDNVYVVSVGDAWNANFSLKGVYKINSSSLNVVDSIKTSDFPSFPGTAIVVDNNLIVVGSDGVRKVAKEKLVLGDLLIKNTDVITSGVSYSTIYGIAYDKKEKKYYLGNPKDFQQNGDVAIFDNTGKFIKRFDCGINPGTIRIIN